MLNRKPLLIKVANTAQVRPQSGLGSADVVVEHYSEGSITRFTALFLTNAPTKVGSVRSCRLIDLELPVIFDAALVCSGTSPGVKELMRKSPAYVNNLTMISDMGRGNQCPTCPMYRVAGVAPNNLFASAVRAWQELDKRGNNVPSTFRSWTFDPKPPSGGQPVSSVDVGYRSGIVNWKYDPATGQWTRSLKGVRQVDKNTNQPVTASNIAVVFAHHQPTLIQEDVGGSKSIEIQVWGEGPLQFFRDGQKYVGKWRRPAEPAVLEFYDSNGNRLSLKPGNTWIEMAPLFEFPVVSK